ncbi:terpene synthase 10-like [Euphorbia lathyris]|uniref:terpene synthase 10-like n=1 Tax=Euphorbia lathyris TaxID=212925 RepID=UPI0033139119
MQFTSLQLKNQLATTSSERREKLLDGLIRPLLVTSTQQVVDFFTKALAGNVFEPVLSNVGVFGIYTLSLRVRRSANYKPTIWDSDFVLSLRSQYKEEKYTNRIRKLKEEVKTMLIKPITPLDQLELIDILQRLGLAYHFQDQIHGILMSIFNKKHSDKSIKNDLHSTALEFRLLRQHGFNIPQETFSDFQDEVGNLKTNLYDDYKGMLSLYEASFLSEEGEDVLDAAREFGYNNLRKHIQQNQETDPYYAKLINHALELPLHWRMQRLESRWFIDMYEVKQGMDSHILELAKLDFNNVQATYQADLQYTSCWWKSTCLAEKLRFSRDRIVENFLWTVGVMYEPRFSYCRRMATKINALVTTIDDIYDVYGTLEELELFTDAVQRWDVNEIEQLPDYMKICFLALHNTINEIGYDVLKEQGFHIIPFLKKTWVDLCEAYLVEAKWYHSKYTPTLEEYIENAWISISGPVALVHAFFLTKDTVRIDRLKYLKEYPKILRLSSMILRLADDLGTSSDELKRGDVPKSIQCYMNESGASEEEARQYIQSLISETWKEMNKQGREGSPLFSKEFIAGAMDLARMAQCMYQNGDGHGIQEGETKDRVLSPLVQPISI